MKTNFIIMADGLDSIRNGSFIKIGIDGSVSRFINGDYMGTEVYDPKREQRITDKRIYTFREAKKHLPGCFGYARSKS